MNLRDYVNSLQFQFTPYTSSIEHMIEGYAFVFDARIEYFHEKIRLCFSIFLVNEALKLNIQIAIGCLSEKKMDCNILLSKEEKHSNARLSTIIDNILFELQMHSIRLNWSIKRIDASESTKQAVHIFFDTIGYEYDRENYCSFYNEVLKYQEYILYKKLKKKHKEECDFIDSLIKDLPEPTESFYKWLNYKYMPEHRYFFYKYHKKQFVKGICSVCGNEIELLRKKNNDLGICPHCGKQLTYRSKNRNNSIFARDWIIYPVIIKGVAYIQIYEVIKGFSNYKQKISLIPCFLAVLRNNHVYFLTKKYFLKYGCSRWGFSKGALQDIDYILRTATKSKIYNLHVFSKILSFKQCGNLRKSIQSKDYSGSTLYTAIALYNDWVLETLYKIGNKELMLRREAYFMKTYSFRPPRAPKRKLHKELGIRKSYMRLLPVASSKDLMIMQSLTESNIDISATDLEKLLPYNPTISIIKFLRGIEFARVKKYLQLQIQMEEQHDKDLITAMYREYINTISLNTFTTAKEKLLCTFPNNLQLAYNSMKFANRHNVDAQKVYAAIQKYKEQYTFEYGNYIVKAPKSLHDIDREGTILGHCLSRYAEKVQNGATAILFLREKNNIETPFYTLECIGDKVLQCRGFENKSPTLEVEHFLLHYKHYLERGGMYNGIYS